MSKRVKNGRLSYVTRFYLVSLKAATRGTAPICFLPFSLDRKKSIIYYCCSKLICDGCAYANKIRQQEESLDCSCPFCRQPVPTEEEADAHAMKRVKANDPVSLLDVGLKCCREGDYRSAFEYWTKAAELGNVDAHHSLSVMYRGGGRGVEKDIEKEWYHLEEAAIAGHPEARFYLAYYEEHKNDRIDRAVRHLIIAANLGCDDSIRELKECYKDGHVSKEDFAAALRAHQAAVDATKSPQRDSAANS